MSAALMQNCHVDRVCVINSTAHYLHGSSASPGVARGICMHGGVSQGECGFGSKREHGLCPRTKRAFCASSGYEGEPGSFAVDDGAGRRSRQSVSFRGSLSGEWIGRLVVGSGCLVLGEELSAASYVIRHYVRKRR